MTQSKPNILFVCARNQWRSPTAEKIYRNDPRINVRSAGMRDKSPHKLSDADIEWADLILVMEENFKSWIRRHFQRREMPRMESLDIPDEYQYMDAELVELIRNGSEPHIGEFLRGEG